MSIEAWEEAFITGLRTEAHGLKECFTTFSFQALAFASGVLVFVLGANPENYVAALACVPPIALLMAVSRVGAHKYTSAHRNHGYELHLNRTKRIDCSQPPWLESRWKPEMRHLPWEEAIRAWRVVQPTLFRRLYKTPQNDPLAKRFKQMPALLSVLNGLRPSLYKLDDSITCKVEKFKRTHQPDIYPWFLPALLTEHTQLNTADGPRDAGAVYYAGSYLFTTLGILLLMQYFLLVPLLLSVLRASVSHHYWYATLNGAILGISLVFIILRSIRIRRRRELLERELLSIHSCAIVWHAVVLAHYIAVERCGNTFRGYTETVAQIASELSQDPFDLHRWVHQQRTAT